MIANISPNHLSYEDTLNTLKYANRAKNIRVSALQQLVQPDDHVRSFAMSLVQLSCDCWLLVCTPVSDVAGNTRIAWVVLT